MMKSMRVVEPAPRNKYGETVSCGIPGCSIVPFEGKPYCQDHVFKHPYVLDLMERMRQSEEQDKAVLMEGSKAVVVGSITYDEILLQLRVKRSRTEEHLSQKLQVSRDVIHGYCVAMQKQGLVRISRTEKGYQLVTILETEVDSSE